MMFPLNVPDVELRHMAARVLRLVDHVAVYTVDRTAYDDMLRALEKDDPKVDVSDAFYRLLNCCVRGGDGFLVSLAGMLITSGAVDASIGGLLKLDPDVRRRVLPLVEAICLGDVELARAWTAGQLDPVVDTTKVA